eukprot:Hpha_TRINITY_DN15119_c6_g3::TRINITY_DN15119_c6_g3_i1::g.126774::m.126774
MFGCRWDWLVRQGDTPDEARTKTTMFPFALCIVLFTAVLVVNGLLGTSQVVSVIGNGIGAIAFLQFIVGVVTNAVPVCYLMDVLILLCTLGICAVDLAQAATSWPYRAMTMMVLVLDMALVFKRYHMPRFIIPFVLVYQTALQVESLFRFGLYE